ncbi:alpha/beta fold hydrolase [Motiliproteus sp. MSK22-1]|uniref:alpha/beta fold hydrolase n=1 Tax=Motiliproteus sp. MSK22-1 TaxID=1897630 RepID=UPI000978A206|nr:alpha/beta hydrolase [Motiliproteus sp. MSK22-1]OMH31673.1 alpha/beta hydrolase [Motiliproteus sp. MSK22-1]
MSKENYRQELIEKIEVPVQQGQIMAGLVKTTYLSAGEGPVVICLHGAGAGAVTWYPSISVIAQNFHVIAPDIVGYGESDKPDGAYDRPYFSAWLKEFMSALEISKAHIVGLSQGGAVALQFALDNPEMVDKLVLVDSGALGAQPSVLPFIGMIWLNSFPSLLANRFYSRYILHNPDNRDPNHGYYSVEVIKREGGKKAFTQGRGAAVSAISEDSLGQIQSDTLIIWGEKDRLFSIEHGEAAARMIPNATFHPIQDAGHLPLMDQPEAFNKALLEFLKEKRQAL